MFDIPDVAIILEVYRLIDELEIEALYCDQKNALEMERALHAQVKKAYFRFYKQSHLVIEAERR
jgi:hypothetical protein